MDVIIRMELWKENELFLLEEGLLGNLRNNELSFHYDNMEHTIMFNKEKMTFQRENDEYCFHLDIQDEPKCNFLLKETNTMLDIHVEKASFKMNNHQIEFDYCIETDDHQNTISITWQEKEC